MKRVRVAALAIVSVALVASSRGPLSAAGPALSADDVRRVLSQAAAEAQAAGLRATIAVTDDESNVLGVFRMEGAPAFACVGAPDAVCSASGPLSGQGLLGLQLQSELAAVTKAATGALLSSGGNAFSTRTASFIVQSNFPPAIDSTPGGPLFGVQFSTLPCSDVRVTERALPFVNVGLAADPGGLPLYKDGRRVGGVGVEGDGRYTFDPKPAEPDPTAEERAAAGGTRGFEAPALIRGDNILVDGIRLPLVDAVAEVGTTVAPVPGQDLFPPRAAPPSAFVPATVGGVAGQADPRYPTRAGAVLTADDVARILAQGAQQSVVTRAAIRQPLGSNARVSIAVVDLDGSLLGFFQNEDAPNFGRDVAVQKARTSAFFSSPLAGALLRAAGFATYLQESGVPLDGSIGYSSRGVGFLAQPFFPPGIAGTDPGPFSRPIAEWSPFNTGLQLDLLGFPDVAVPGGCARPVPGLPNGITIFPGGVPLFKGGRLAGAIGVSGDGVDQDDLVAAAGAAGFDTPPERRSDQLVVRGVRIPWQKFPRHPSL